MKKMMMWGLVAAVTVIGFVGSPAQAKELGVQPLDGKTVVEGRRGGRRGGRGGYWRGGRGGYWRGGGWGGGFYYSSGPRYYAPAPAPVVIVQPAPVYYGGTVSCY